MAKPLTKKQKEKMVRISEVNNASRYFTVKGVRYEQVGTRLNSNGSWSISVKNLDMDKGADRYKWVGAETLDKILNR